MALRLFSMQVGACVLALAASCVDSKPFQKYSPDLICQPACTAIMIIDPTQQPMRGFHNNIPSDGAQIRQRDTRQLMECARFLVFSCAVHVVSCASQWSFVTLARLVPSCLSLVCRGFCALSRLSLASCCRRGPAHRTRIQKEEAHGRAPLYHSDEAKRLALADSL